MQPAETTSPKPFVFVLMPFDRAFDNVYQLGIKDACKEAGAYCQRVDEQYIDGCILDRVYNQIAKADIIVADMTGQNPNVFFEVGYSYALNKRVVLLSKKADDIPFDLKQYQHIVYGASIVNLKADLAKRVRWMIENPTDKAIQSHSQLQFFYRGILLDNGVEVPYLSHQFEGVHQFFIKIDIHNSTTSTIEKASFGIGFITELETSSLDRKLGSAETFTLPDSRWLHVLRNKYQLLPGAWDRCLIKLECKNTISYGDNFDMVLRAFTDTGTYDYPCTFLVTKKEESPDMV